MKSKFEAEDPKRVVPKTVRLLATLAIDRNDDNELPRCTKSSTVMPDPNRGDPKQLNDRSGNELPRWTQSRMLADDPKRPSPKKEIALPTRTN